MKYINPKFLLFGIANVESLNSEPIPKSGFDYTRKR